MADVEVEELPGLLNLLDPIFCLNETFTAFPHRTSNLQFYGIVLPESRAELHRYRN